MRTLFLLALLALAASIASAQYYTQAGGFYEQGNTGGECEQEQARLDSCKDYVMERCFTMKDFPLTWPWRWWKGGCEHEVRNQCCEQLNQVSQQCRCKAIWRAVQGDLGGFLGLQQGEVGKRIQRAKILPSKCNMGTDCNFPLTTGYYW